MEFISRHGAEVDNDLEELWRRIVFNICIKNTDDHLRNHGFLLTPKGWVLSPAYDINPNEYGRELNLNITESGNALDLDLAREVSAHFRLTDQKASSIIKKVTNAVKEWQKIAGECAISKSEQERVSGAFG